MNIYNYAMYVRVSAVDKEDFWERGGSRHWIFIDVVPAGETNAVAPRKPRQNGGACAHSAA